MVPMKNAQLTLLSDDRPWRLDEGTRRVGREGLAKARAALAAHLPDDPHGPDERRDDHELAA